MSLSQSLFASNVAFAGFCHILLPFLDLLFVRFFCRRLFAKFFDLRSLLSVSLPLKSVGTPPPLPRESCFYKPRNNMNHVQTPWNSVDGFGIALNPNKGHSVSSQLDQTELWQCRHIPSLFASLSHGRYSRSRARVALGREVQLPMSFPWPVFPGLDQDLFPPWFSSFFGIRFQNGAKECIV